MRVALGLVTSTEIREIMTRSLKESFALTFCTHEQEILQSLTATSVDLVFIDSVAGDTDDPALEVIKAIRGHAKGSAAQLIFLSQVNDTDLLVQAFERGIDDFLVYPFAPEELRARVEARFRRLRDMPVAHDLFWCGDLRFSLATQRVVYTDADEERNIELTPNEFKILYLLARNEGKILSRQSILQNVWGNNLHVVERTVDKHICSLRRKMGGRARYVCSVPGSGYSFDVTQVDGDSSQSLEDDGVRISPKVSV